MSLSCPALPAPRRASLFLYNRGYSGHTLQRLLDVFDRTWNHGCCQDGVWDLVCVQIGVNDVSVCMDTGLSASAKDRYLETYRNHFSLLLSRIRADFFGPLLILEPFLFPSSCQSSKLDGCEGTDCLPHGRVLQTLFRRFSPPPGSPRRRLSCVALFSFDLGRHSSYPRAAASFSPP